jgi:signal transduction histidine kinase
MRQDNGMIGTARLFVILVSIAGLLTAAVTLAQANWRSDRVLEFIAYLLMGALSSRLKVSLPGVTGTLSVNFIFVLLAVTELQRADVLTIGCVATLAQCIVATHKRPKLAQLALNLGNAVLSGVLCDIVYHASALRRVDASMPVLLLCAALSYFLVNTLVVAEIIALTEKKGIGKVWRDNFFWTGPQYIFGAALVGVIHVCNTHFGWQYAVLAFPGIYLLDRSYRVYLGRLAEEKQHVRDNEEAYEQLAKAQQHLMTLSRQAGMAEVATGVLHNVGNVLNSVNVSATIVADKIRESHITNLATLAGMLEEHSSDLADFLNHDPKGQRVVPYLAKLAVRLGNERQVMLQELQLLTGHIEHIKEIVATQQNYGKVSGLIEIVSLPDLVEDAIRIVEPGLNRRGIHIERDHETVPPVALDKHNVLQILLNLLRNAEEAIAEAGKPEKLIHIRISRPGDDEVRVEVRDTGVGLAPENLTRIFAHGFTTKSDGHGFGLHSGALAAKQMGGTLRADSEGPGLGATFTLELPLAATTVGAGDARIGEGPQADLTSSERTTTQERGSSTQERYRAPVGLSVSRYPPRHHLEHNQWVPVSSPTATQAFPAAP